MLGRMNSVILLLKLLFLFGTTKTSNGIKKVKFKSAAGK
jgi:hypothetical protein